MLWQHRASRCTALLNAQPLPIAGLRRATAAGTGRRAIRASCSKGLAVCSWPTSRRADVPLQAPEAAKAGDSSPPWRCSGQPQQEARRSPCSCASADHRVHVLRHPVRGAPRPSASAIAASRAAPAAGHDDTPALSMLPPAPPAPLRGISKAGGGFRCGVGAYRVRDAREEDDRPVHAHLLVEPEHSWSMKS